MYQNGVLLKTGTDYTATSGTSVVLTTGASVSDVVEMIVYDVFASADFYNRTDSDSRYVNIDGDTMTGSLDLNGTELILDVDGDTSITADTDDRIDFKIAGSDRGNIHYDGNDFFSIESNDYLTLVQNQTAERGLILGPTYFKPYNANDNQLDLGIGAARWKDLYLSGGAYIGGTGSANYLDDYEEGGFDPTIKNEANTNLSVTYVDAYNHARYVKIGAIVFVQFTVNISALSGDSGSDNLILNNLPFTSKAYAANSNGGFNITYQNNVDTVSTFGMVLGSSTSLRFYQSNTTPLYSSALQSNSWFQGYGHYETDS